jgi:hypothetical protein
MKQGPMALPAIVINGKPGRAEMKGLSAAA